MNDPKASPSRRSRWRNVVAVSVMWAGLATLAVTDTATAAAETRPTADKGDSSVASSVRCPPRGSASSRRSALPCTASRRTAPS